MAVRQLFVILRKYSSDSPLFLLRFLQKKPIFLQEPKKKLNMQLRMKQLTPQRLLHMGILCSVLFLCRCSLLSSSGLKHAKGLGYSVPASWVETQSEVDSDRAFKLNSGSTVTLTSSCQGIRQVSLKNLTKDLLLGARKIKFIRQEPLIIAQTEALFSHVNATVEGKAFQLMFVVLRKNNCVFDFSLVSPQPIPQNELEEFLNFAKSFNYGQS
mgnify:CR=1 FL=1